MDSSKKGGGGRQGRTSHRTADIQPRPEALGQSRAPWNLPQYPDFNANHSQYLLE
ncbi:hypothetical protein [Paracidovorax anthurii]|uniref:hypothetical protein n=1 Tax=Paracidovorax anthurii TaxID=78229 RepID=UPI0039EF3C90